MILLAIIVIIGLISALGLIFGSIRTVLKWLLTKISTLIPVLVVYSIVNNTVNSMLVGIVAALVAWLVLKKVLKHPTLKASFDICSSGLLVSTLFFVFGANATGQSTVYALLYYLLYVIAWAGLSTANIISSKNQYDSELQVSYYLRLAVFALSSLYAFLIIGVIGLLNIHSLHNIPWSVRFVASIGIAFISSFLMTKYFMSLLGCRKIADFDSSAPKSTNTGDYIVIKQKLEAINGFDNDIQSDIRDMQKSFYGLCSEFQKSQVWNDTHEAQLEQIQAKSDEYIGYMNNSYAEDESASDLDKAMALFMIDDIKDITEEALRKQRNTLIKAYHPDEGIDNDTYAQKINDAYNLLKNAI